MSPRDDDQPPAADLLARLSRLNPTVVVVATVVLFLGVLLLPDLAAAALVLVLVAALGWLLTRTWRVLPRAERTVRVAVLGLLVAVALVRLLF